MDNIRAHVMISGRVQGVFFRMETQKTARQNHVTGWVRNTPDGRVEAVFEGGKDAVEKVLRWCETGPPHARVENMDVSRGTFQGEFSSFALQG